jgi:hypothetical protein
MERYKNPFYEGGDKPRIKDSTDTVRLTAEMFFGDNGHSGYFTRKQFLEYGQSLRDREAQDLSTALKLMKEGLIMGGSLVKRPDRVGRVYVHPDFYKSRARVGVKLILEHGLEGFIGDYQEGYISIQFTLEDLISEAKKEV